MTGFADLDPIPLTLEWLKGHPDVLAQLGGPEHISGLKEDPFPHLEVRAGVTEVGDMQTQPVDGGIDFQVWGSPLNVHGPAVLRRACLVVCRAMTDLLYTEEPLPGGHVVSQVRVTRNPVVQDLTNGQRRWIFSVSLRMHATE